MGVLAPCPVSTLAPPCLGDIAPSRYHPFRNPSRLQVYHGSMATHHDWFPEIFGTLDTCATLLTLVTSPGHPTPPGALPGALSSLDALPLTVEIYRSVPFLAPSYVGHTRPAPTIIEPGPSILSEGSHTTHVYLLRFTPPRGSPPSTTRSTTAYTDFLCPSCTCLVDFPPFLRHVGPNTGTSYRPGGPAHGYSQSPVGSPFLVVRHSPDPAHFGPCFGQVPPVPPKHLLQ